MKTLRTLSFLFALVAVPSLAIAGTGKNADDKAARKAARQAHHAEMLEKFDVNDDGKLDVGERATKRDTLANQLFDRLDSNGDGEISRAEFKAGRELRHDKRVKNGKQRKHGKGARRIKAATAAKIAKSV